MAGESIRRGIRGPVLKQLQQTALLPLTCLPQAILCLFPLSLILVVLLVPVLPTVLAAAAAAAVLAVHDQSACDYARTLSKVPLKPSRKVFPSSVRSHER